MDIEELSVRITGDSSSLQTAMSGANEALSGFGAVAVKLGPILGAAGVAGLLKTVADAAAECQQAFADAEVDQLRFNAAVAASNTITAAGKTRLEDLAKSFATLAGEDDDAVLGMEAMLAATGRTTDEIEKMLPAALGLANATGTSLDSALQQLNKTFSGSIGRLGQITPELQGLSEEELKNGDAVDVMIAKYGNLSTALSGSAKTSVANFETALGNMKESIGAVVENGIRPFRDSLTELLQKMNDESSGISQFAGGFNSVVEIFKELGLSLIGKGDVIQAVGDAISQVEQKTRILLQTYGSVQDSAQRRADDEKAVGVAAAKAAGDAAKAWEEANKKIINGRKDATKVYEDELAKIDTRVLLGLITEQEAAGAKYEANRELMDKLIDLGYTGAEESKQIGDQTLRDALARDDELYNATEDGQKKIAAMHKEVADQRVIDERNARLQSALTTTAMLAEEASRVDAVEQSSTDRTAYEREYVDTAKSLSQSLADEATITANAILTEEAALTMGVRKEIIDRTALEYEAYSTVVGYMSNMVDGYSAAAAAKTAAEEAHTVAVQAEVTSQDALISEQVAAVVGYSEKITDAYAVAAEKKTGFEEGFTQAVATETASQTALQDEAIQTQIGYANDLSGANYDAAAEAKAAWLAAADDTKQGQLAAVTPIQRAWKDFSDGAIADAKDWTKELKEAEKALRDGIESAFNDLGEALAEGDDAWLAFGNAAEEPLKKIIGALGDQLAAMALAAALAGNWIGAAAAAAGAVAAWMTAGATSTFAETIASFFGGGSSSSSEPAAVPTTPDREEPTPSGGSNVYIPPDIDREYRDRFAMGGISLGGLALVGERGPELVDLPRGARVFNNEESRQMVAESRNVNIVFNSPIALDPIEMRTEFERLNRQLAFEGAF